jgi:hypothetical protein
MCKNGRWEEAMVKATLIVHGKKIPITEAEIPGMTKAVGKKFMAIQRNTWLTAKGVGEKLRGKW